MSENNIVRVANGILASLVFSLKPVYTGNSFTDAATDVVCKRLRKKFDFAYQIEVGAVQSTVKLAQGIATPLVRSTVRIQAPMTVKGCGSKDACVRHMNVIRTDMSNIADMTEEQYTSYGQLLQEHIAALNAAYTARVPLGYVMNLDDVDVNYTLA